MSNKRTAKARAANKQKSHYLEVGMHVEDNYQGKGTRDVGTVSKNYRGASTPSTKANTAARSKHDGAVEEAGSPYRRSKRKRRAPSEYCRVAFSPGNSIISS